MEWTDLTDILVCRKFGHLFTITKPQYRNDVVEWFCLDKDKQTVAEGKTIRVAKAKAECKRVLKEISESDTTIYVKSNNKLTRKRYGRRK